MKRNIRGVLKEFKNITIQGGHDRMFILLNGEDSEPIMEELSKVFGIQSFSLAVKAEKQINEMKEVGLTLVKQLYQEGATFKVSTRRGDKSFELDTNDINHAIGSYILTNLEGIKVNVKNPDINLIVDVRRDGVYMSSEIIRGAGGLPVGSSGRQCLCSQEELIVLSPGI